MHTAENSRKHCFRDMLHNSQCQGRLAWLPDSTEKTLPVFEETKIGQYKACQGEEISAPTKARKKLSPPPLP